VGVPFARDMVNDSRVRDVGQGNIDSALSEARYNAATDVRDNFCFGGAVSFCYRRRCCDIACTTVWLKCSLCDCIAKDRMCKR